MASIITIQDSRVLTGESIGNLRKHLSRENRVIVITEERIYQLYRSLLQEYEIIRIEGGEEHKTLNSVDRITNELIRMGADRNTFLVGFGGGIVCDITGFVASIYMRGCRFGFVATTLLAQVDASVGGKNGVNYQGYKNILGVFNQPGFVICDPEVLDTLETREYVAGFSEIVKAAMIADVGLFRYLEEHIEQALQRNRVCLERIISESIRIKVSFVERDTRETGLRRLLNLGHTFGHALEKNGVTLHGEAVSIGLCLASRVAVRLGYMALEECERVVGLLKRFSLPVESPVPVLQLVEAMHKDKKKDGEYIHLILPVGIGGCKEERISFEKLIDWITNI